MRTLCDAYYEEDESQLTCFSGHIFIGSGNKKNHRPGDTQPGITPKSQN